MLTQTIEINLTQSKLSSIIMRSEEKGREIAFSVIDEAGDPVDLTDYSVKFLMLKPDENVIYADVISGVLTQTEQMTTSKGAGYYCIRIIDAGTVIYSGQGRVLIDDHVIDDETLNSISEVDGLIFPDDFATIPWVEEYVAEHSGSDVIANPDTVPTDTLDSVTISGTTYDIIHPAEDASGNPIEITDAAASPMIKCVSAITGYQEGSGTPSPINVRAIHAFTSGNITIKDINNVTQATHTANFTDPIYQGSVDFVEGEVNEQWKVIDLGDLTWTYASGSQQFRSSRIADIEEPANLTIMPNSTCEIYETITYQNISSANNAFTVIFASSTDHGKVYVKDSRYTDAAAFTSAVTGIKLAYKLAASTTEIITPSVVNTLSGYNKIESSTGDLDITYIRQPYEPIIRSAEQADNDLIRITAAYDAASLSNTDVAINYQDYDALVIYVNDALTQCGVSSLFTREYMDYCRANSRTLTFFPFGSAYVSYNILADKLEYAGDNNQGFYIIRIDGINFRR